MEQEPVNFFEAQFRRQVGEREFVLNPFESLAVDYVKGEVLDLGSGLGNLSLEAARRGHTVVAVDSSPTAVARIDDDARREGLPVKAVQANLATWDIDRPYDTIVAIGLLMFFPRKRARGLLRGIREHVRPGGHAIVNVLIEGTTYLEMFEQDNYHLFARRELEACFSDWTLLCSRYDSYPAPGETTKEFSTVIAER